MEEPAPQSGPHRTFFSRSSVKSPPFCLDRSSPSSQRAGIEASQGKERLPKPGTPDRDPAPFSGLARLLAQSSFHRSQRHEGSLPISWHAGASNRFASEGILRESSGRSFVGPAIGRYAVTAPQAARAWRHSAAIAGPIRRAFGHKLIHGAELPHRQPPDGDRVHFLRRNGGSPQKIAIPLPFIRLPVPRQPPSQEWACNCIVCRKLR